MTMIEGGTFEFSKSQSFTAVAAVPNACCCCCFDRFDAIPPHRNGTILEIDLIERSH